LLLFDVGIAGEAADTLFSLAAMLNFKPIVADFLYLHGLVLLDYSSVCHLYTHRRIMRLDELSSVERLFIKTKNRT
jgi:hypothetical protein